ncbi:MAG: hypothetical protein AB1813_24035 [Verrucomicrobiota bacterium]
MHSKKLLMLRLSLATVVLSVIHSGAWTMAREPVKSPRAQANEIRVSRSSSERDPDLVRNAPGNAKGRALMESLRKVPPGDATTPTTRKRVTFRSPKDPKFQDEQKTPHRTNAGKVVVN